jgi:nicotinamidase-related amidase
MRTALLIVDIQNDYFPGGKNELAGPVEAAAKARMLLDAFRAKKMFVVHVRHESTRPGATFFIPGTPGAQIHESVKPLDGETVITKNFPNSFRATELLITLHNAQVSRLVVCGMMTHMCIDTTVRAAYDNGFEVMLAHDACATKNLTFDGKAIPAKDVQQAFLGAIDGTFAKVTPAEQILKKNNPVESGRSAGAGGSLARVRLNSIRLA